MCSKGKVIKDINAFKECVYDIFCQCYNQCVNLAPDFKKTQPICSEILYDNNKDESTYQDIITNSINFFLDSYLIVLSGEKFYIPSKDNIKLKLSWENIKNLEDTEKKELFWLFRKVVVDSILKICLSQIYKSKKGVNLKIYSVGSTNMSSDYDITLYGETDEKIFVMENFQQIFKWYFKEDSSIVFDTNIYGQAYIYFNKEEQIMSVKANCGQDFYYIQETSFKDPVIMWAIIRYLKDLRESFGESIFNQVYSFMSKKLVDLPVFEMSFKTFIYLNNKDPNSVNYLNLLKLKDHFLKQYGQSQEERLIGIYDFTSTINYYGVETYVTKGAFIDTVVNLQMCKNEIVPLSSLDYICSILENVSFYFTHNNKTKYILRIRSTLEKLIFFKGYDSLQDNLNSINNVLQPLEKKVNKDGRDIFEYDSNYCTSIIQSDTVINLLTCPKYVFFSILMNLVYNLLKIYSQVDTDKITPFFYEKFVVKKFLDGIGNTSNLVSSNSSSISNLIDK